MKKYLLVVFAAVLLMDACKKDSTAAFNTSSGTYYLNQQVTFNNTSNGGTSNWNFGDGTTSAVKSPTHAYSQPGTYNVTLTVGNSVATKSISVFHGTSSFQIFNGTSENIAMFTFSADASDYVIDYIDQGSVSGGSRGEVYYTLDSTIYLGGTLPGTDSTFYVAPPNYPFKLTKNTLNILQLNNNTQIYILNSLPAAQTKVQDIVSKSLARKTNMAKIAR